MTKHVNFLILLLSFTCFSFAQTVTIGNQVWTSNNLSSAKFRNGDPIIEAKTDAEWKTAGENSQPAWCYYDNKPANGVKYGKLYNWYAVNDLRGLAPAGFHIPTDEEWRMLINYLGGSSEALKKMKTSKGWYKNGNGNNSSRFTGLPGGCRTNIFYGVELFGYWWSSSKYYTNDPWISPNLALYLELGYYNTLGFAGIYNQNKELGYSVRCLKD